MVEIYTTYSVKIKHYNHIFKDTVVIYRNMVDYFLPVCLEKWDDISQLGNDLQKVNYVERITHRTKSHPDPEYDFDGKFYKVPSYLRRAAISEAIGKISSYKSNLTNWEKKDPLTRGRVPSVPKAGFSFPCLYKINMYTQDEPYQARIKVYIRNTWDWITVSLKKSDMDYINRECIHRKKCNPTLVKRGKEWFLDFPFTENAKLSDTDILNQTIIAVDLGINSAATVSVMLSDGTILGRYFLKLPKEYDSLKHAINCIKKAQQNRNHRTPRLWAVAKGINNDIAVKTAAFIMEIAAKYNADTIVFEHLDLQGKKRGSKKQRLHMWRSQYVQAMVTDKAHRAGMRISRICAWGTSKFAYDGSGTVRRGEKGDFNSYSMCRFKNGKVYNCDLSASYNIGSRYFIREILKSVPEKVRLALEAKVPQVAKRSTCTLSTLISLSAELMSLAA